MALWNVRGINDHEKHPAFLSWLNNINKVTFGAILETHIKESNFTRLMAVICPGWSFASNHSDDDDGRIILFWKAPTVISILHSSRQSITFKVTIPDIPSFTVTAVYAANTAEERKLMWDSLSHVFSAFSLHSSPWIIGGDFNEIFHCAEHSSPAFNSITPQMVEFNSVIQNLEVRDLRYYGPLFTWTNKQPDNPIAKKLDRVLINESWLLIFHNVLLTFSVQSSLIIPQRSSL